MKQLITLIVNGQSHEVAVEPQTILLDVLRDELGLTGTKRGCDYGGCGTCTVLMDGKPVLSCLTLAVDAQDKEITTVEGLARDGKLSPLQQAFIEQGAIQCGFCTPGMLLSAQALLDKTPEPTEEEVRHAISGNLCRCTGYHKIVKAILDVAKRRKEDTKVLTVPKHSAVGKRVPRVDGSLKATGEARFTDDIALPNMLHGKILRSPYPHARIISIDTSKAEALPGVKAVITGRDTGIVRFSFIDTPRYPADQCPLAVDKVRFIGEDVAAVAATSEVIAEEALSLIQIKYEELPAVFDPEEALREGAPRIHDKIVPNTTTAWEDFGVTRKAKSYEAANNISNQTLITIGDAEQGFKESDYVRKDRFTIPATSHVALEPHVAIARFDSSGKLDMWLSHMGYEHKRYWLAKMLGIPISRVRVNKTYVGGAFGGKITIFPYEFLAAFLSRKTRRPVKITLSRDEVLSTCPPSRRMIIEVKTGVKRDGTLVAQHMKIIDDVGAYRSSSPTALYLAHVFRHAIYNIPNIKHEGIGVYTNKLSTGPKRGHGLQQASFAVESQIDIIAEELGISPLEFRLKNLRSRGDILPNGDTLLSYGLPDALKQAAQASNWAEKWTKKPDRGIGIGVASMFSGAHNYPFGSAAIIKVNPDGRFTLFTGQTEFGQGADTAMAQIAAQELGLSVDDLVVVSGDSELCPYDIGNWLSAGVYVSGRAVRNAAADAKRQFLAYAAEIFDVQLNDLSIDQGHVYVHADPTKAVSFVDLYKYGIQIKGGDPIIGKGYAKAVEDVGFWGSSFKGTAALSQGKGRFTDAYGLAAAIAEVEVDKETGKVKVLHLVVSDDCGIDINPLNVEGQLESQAVMGIGDVLFEEVLTEAGRVTNPTLDDYKIPGIMDISKVTTISVQDYEPRGPFGAKEVGETARGAVIPAIANAVCNAIGARIYSLPITPEKILDALLPEG
jgi:CO/xanthine dehydrogenase Mo-binding subunit/aerobic-type carbon monoxide dehydrogenase small subunit (CoxS/CutS family)